MKVDAKHPLYDAFLPRWQVCSDAVAGPHVMSQKADKYLCSLAEGNDSEQAWRDKVAEIKLRYPVARGAEE